MMLSLEWGCFECVVASSPLLSIPALFPRSLVQYGHCKRWWSSSGIHRLFFFFFFFSFLFGCVWSIVSDLRTTPRDLIPPASFSCSRYAKGVLNNWLTYFIKSKGFVLYRGLEMAQSARMLTNIAQYYKYTGDASLLVDNLEKIDGIYRMLSIRRANAERTATSTSFWTISRALLSSAPPGMCRVLSSTSRPC